MCISFLTRIQDRRQWRFDRLYVAPNPLESLEQYQRFIHVDLKEMTKPVLKRELSKVRLRLLYDDNPPGWILKRLEKLQKALQDE